MLRQKLDGARKFVTGGIWDVDPESLSGVRSFGVRFLRVAHLVFKGFKDDECSFHASSLTYNTLMAIVPVLALSLALARGFGFDAYVEKQVRTAIRETFGAWEDVAVDTETVPDGVADNWNEPDSVPVLKGAEAEGKYLIAKELDRITVMIFRKAENISFAALGGIGLTLLLWMVVSVLGRVEASFNRVWGIKTGRPILRKFSDYLSVLIVLPFLIVAATSLPVVDFALKFVDESSAQGIREFLESDVLKNFTVVFMTCACFIFLIFFMPNTKVNFVPGITGGLVSGILFILWIRLCMAMQVGVASYGKIYGSLAIMPIVLAWVYVSWEIVLLGAEVAFAMQNHATYRIEPSSGRANIRSRIILALMVMAETARSMSGKKGFFSASGYASDRRVSVRFVNQVLEELSKAGFMAEITGGRDRYVLARSPETVKVSEVMDSLMSSGAQPEELGLKSVDPAVDQSVRQAFGVFEQSLGSMTVRDLAVSPVQ